MILHWPSATHELNTNGWTILQCPELTQVVGSLRIEIESLIAKETAGTLRHRGRTYGARNVLQDWGGWRSLLSFQDLVEWLAQQLGPDAGLVRVLYFDKPPGLGWSLPWHRDQSIAVREHLEPTQPFRCPTTKAGVPHVEATRDTSIRCSP